MTKNQNTSNSLAARARALAEKTGMPYTAALQSLRTPRGEQPAPKPGFVFTEQVERFVDGRDQIGVEYDLRAFLAERNARRYDCYECGEDVHTATDPMSVQFTVSVFDPDLNPGTYVMMTQYAHLACAPSEIRWAVPADVPSQPFTVRVDAGTEDGEQRVVAYEITATAHLLPGDEPGGPQLPVLLLNAEVENDEPHPSLYEFLDFKAPGNWGRTAGRYAWSTPAPAPWRRAGSPYARPPRPRTRTPGTGTSSSAPSTSPTPSPRPPANAARCCSPRRTAHRAARPQR
ncbi:hypothetical protein ACFYZ9_28280 [Streptomyces sp. NPDC001691]|uniref:hypothetical protein n=1 Tax=Streptomyces sp. NPDC001691 TaxID=3364600 RepID=UPI0036928E9C